LLEYNFNHKGFVAESFVLQELTATIFRNTPIYTYKSAQSEIEFLIEDKGMILPVEVKAGLNLKAKSLTAFN